MQNSGMTYFIVSAGHKTLNNYIISVFGLQT